MPLNHRTSSRRQSSHRLGRFSCWFYAFLVSMLCVLAAIPLLIFYDAARVELHLADHSNETTKRILFMGWTSSLEELNDNWVLEKEMEEFCSSYDSTKPRGYGYYEGQEGGMHVHIFYQQENESARHEIQAVLSQQGCWATFAHEQSLPPFNAAKSLTKTRSYERELVLQDKVQYDAVVNMDLDGVISLPSLSSFHNALAHAMNNPGAVLCANEEKTWLLLLRQIFRWRRKDRTMEEKQKRPLQSADSCSEGFALYSWKAWSSIHCNFDSGTKETNSDTQWLRKSGKNQSAHVNFQQCLKAWNDETWIGVQPDLVIWRKMWWCPWITLVCLLILGSLAWEQLISVATARRLGVPTLFRHYCRKRPNKLR